MYKKQWNIAADFVEVLTIRYPQNIQYHLLAAQIFYEKGILPKAKDLLMTVKASAVGEFKTEVEVLEKKIAEKEKKLKKRIWGKYTDWSKLFDFEAKS